MSGTAAGRAGQSVTGARAAAAPGTPPPRHSRRAAAAGLNVASQGDGRAGGVVLTAGGRGIKD